MRILTALVCLRSHCQLFSLTTRRVTVVSCVSFPCPVSHKNATPPNFPVCFSFPNESRRPPRVLETPAGFTPQKKRGPFITIFPVRTSRVLDLPAKQPTAIAVLNWATVLRHIGGSPHAQSPMTSVEKSTVLSVISWFGAGFLF